MAGAALCVYWMLYSPKKKATAKIHRRRSAAATTGRAPATGEQFELRAVSGLDAQLRVEFRGMIEYAVFHH